MAYEIRTLRNRFMIVNRETRTVATWGDLQKRGYVGIRQDRKRRVSTDSRNYAEQMRDLLNEKPDAVADRFEKRSRSAARAAKQFFAFGDNARAMDDCLLAMEHSLTAVAMHRAALQGA